MIAAPLYNHADCLEEALDSLTSQTASGFALLLVDDRSDDATALIARRYAEADPRVHYVCNEARLGLVGNWRRCFELSRELYPEAEYFAWASDHDRWNPRWLETLAATLDAHPEVVLAYPSSERIASNGEVIRTHHGFETAGISTPGARLRKACRSMYAGDMVYGLMRADHVARADVFRRVLGPDRLLLCELAIQGQFRAVPDVLWQRRHTGRPSRSRQRRSIFLGRAPLHTWATPWVVHAAVLFGVYGVLGRGRPEVGRLRGFGLALGYAGTAIVHYSRRRLHRIAKHWARRRKRLWRARKRVMCWGGKVKNRTRRRVVRLTTRTSKQVRRIWHRWVGPALSTARRRLASRSRERSPGHPPEPLREASEVEGRPSSLQPPDGLLVFDVDGELPDEERELDRSAASDRTRA